MTPKIKEAYVAFLQRKHGRLNTSTATINRAVRAATSYDLVRKRRIIHGESNEVYEAITDRGTSVIVRISHKDYESFRKEAWAIQKCEKAGVPVPDVLLVKNFTDNGKKVSICIESKLNGSPVDAVIASLNRKALRRIVQEAGAVLFKIHSIRLRQYGWHGEQGKSWASLVSSQIDERRSQLLIIAKKIGLSPMKIRKAIDAIIRNRNLYRTDSPHLLHGDYGFDHIFVKDGFIEGVIDFEDFRGGDPVYEFARWSLFNPSGSLAWLMSGYTNKGIFRKHFEKKLLLYKLHHELRLLTYYFDEKNPAGIRHIKKHFYRDLRQVS